jgi:membrane protein required for colicin V production
MPEISSPIDVFLAILLLLGAIRGFRRGFILEVTGLVALFLGAYAALFGSDITAGWLDAHYAIGKEYLGIVSFAVTFLIVALAVHLIGRLLEKLVDITALKPLDRLGGVVFSTGRSWFFWSIILLLIQGFLGTDWLPDSWVQNSVIWPWLDQTARTVLPLIDPWIPEF